MSNRLLFNTQYTSTDLSSTRGNEVEYRHKMQDFRMRYEKQKQINELVYEPPPDPQFLSYDTRDLRSTNGVSDIETSNAEILALAIESQDEERFFRTPRTTVNIDSRDRDQSVYPKSNEYKIELGRKFSNVKEIRLVSSEFINTEQLIRDTPISRANNKIYWQNDDSNNIYVVALDPGNYTASTLQNTIETEMNSVKRLGVSGNVDAFHEFDVTIDSVSSTTTFSSLVTTQLSNPFSTIAGSSIITITQLDHGFTEGQVISISGSNVFAGINPVLLNRTHVVAQVLTTDTYTIDYENDIVETVSGGGGNFVRIGVGKAFSLLFSLDGTPAEILGFANEDTPFSTVQINTDIDREFDINRVVYLDSVYSAIVLESQPSPSLVAGERVYINDVSGTDVDELVNDPAGYIMSELTTDDAAQLMLTTSEELRSLKIPVDIDPGSTGIGGTLNTRILNRPVKLAGETYFFMSSPQIGDMANTGSVDNIFAKISLSSQPNQPLFNTFIGNTKKYDSPLIELSELTFAFYDQQGDLFDFLDTDHSFTLSIKEEVHEVSTGVNMSSQLGFRDET
jgi:hypothetical protein